MFEKSRAINWIIALYVAYILCSFIPFLLPKASARYIPIVILAACCFFYFNDCFRNKAFLCACLYSFAILLASQFHVLSGLGYGRGGIDTVLIDLGFTLPPVAMSAVLYSNRRILGAIRLIDIFIYLSIIITAGWMIPILLNDRSIARKIAYLESSRMDQQTLELKFGYWDYTMCHIISLFFALFWGLFATSMTKYRKLFYGIMIAIIVFFILNLTITTTFIYFFVAVALLIYHKFKKYSIVGLVLLLAGLLLFVINIDAIVDYLWVNYKDTDMAMKILDFRDILNGGTGRHLTIDGRINFQQDAIDGFFNNILIGSEYSGGGHSILLNRLGTTGLIGFIPYALMLYFIFIQWYKAIPSSSKYYYLLAWLGVIILLYNKNCFGSAGFCFICIAMPCLCFTFNYPETILPNNRIRTES